MRERLLATLLLAVAACGGAPPVEQPKQQPAIGAKEAEKGAKDVVTSIYESIGHGDSDGLMTLVSDKLVVFGPRRGDAEANRSDAIVALGKEVSAKKKVPLTSSTLQVTPTEGGHSAWAFDIVDVGGEPLVVTAVLSNSDDIWLVGAAALARAPAAKIAAKELARDAIVPPGMTGVPAKIEPLAKGAAEKFQRGLTDQAVWGDELAHDGGLVVGPTAGEVAHGKKDIKKLWKKRVKANTREVVVGELCAATTPDGQLAWVSVPVTRASDEGASVPLRVFAIYEKHADDWKLVALQESVAIDQPGAGSVLAKKAPPAPAAKPEAKPEDAAPANPDKADKPKKKKKKKPAPPPDAEPDSESAKTDDDAPAKPMHKRKKPAADDDGEQLSAQPRKHKRHASDDDVAVQDD